MQNIFLNEMDVVSHSLLNASWKTLSAAEALIHQTGETSRTTSTVTSQGLIRPIMLYVNHSHTVASTAMSVGVNLRALEK